MATTLQTAHVYRNVMESLVLDEVDKQLKALPAKIANYINATEVVVYALNRLPSLYATSEKGLQQQRLRANRDLHPQITTAVRQAIIAIQRDPLRSTVPLRADEQYRDAWDALRELRRLLHVDSLTWSNVVDHVENTLIRTARGEITWRKRNSHLAEGHEWRDSRHML
jgi:Late competence development protein ComFB